MPNETGNTKEELMSAAQKRIDEYLGKKGVVTNVLKKKNKVK